MLGGTYGLLSNKPSITFIELLLYARNLTHPLTILLLNP